MNEELNLVPNFDYTEDQKAAFVAFASQPIFADVTVMLNGDFIGGRPKGGH